MKKEIADLYLQLQHFVETSDIQAVKNLISEHFESLCTAGKHRSTLLHDIIESNQFEMLREIFQTFDEQFKNPALAPACKAIEAAARKNFFDQPDAWGDTPLMLAARYDQPDLLVKFLQNQANVNHANRAGSTPLLEAVEEESLPMVQELLRHGADVHQRNGAGKNAEQLADSKENSLLWKMLFNAKAAPSSMAGTDTASEHMDDLAFAQSFLQILASNDMAAATNYLEDIAAISTDGKIPVTPYMLKSLQDHPKAFKLLLQYKNGYESTDSRDGGERFAAETAPGGDGVKIIGTPEGMHCALAADFP